MYFNILYSNIFHILFTPIYFSVTLDVSNCRQQNLKNTHIFHAVETCI